MSRCSHHWFHNHCTHIHSIPKIAEAIFEKQTTISCVLQLLWSSFEKMKEPRPVQIVDIENHSYTLKYDSLIKVLGQPEIIDRKVAVISVAGAFRKGKSFLLGFLLRYLNAQVCVLKFLMSKERIPTIVITNSMQRKTLPIGWKMEAMF